MMKRLKFHIKRMLIRERIVPVMITNVPNKLLEGKIALVSGGSSGIGLGIAKKMIESGCKVIIIGSKETKLKHVALNINADYLVLDVRNVDEISSKIETLTQDINIDILVNSAGVHCADKFGEITEETWNNVININLRGLYFLSQTIAHHMKKKKIKGHVLNISSASSLKPSWTPYEISKRGVDGITKGMAHKLISDGIVVNGLAPGPTATPMLNIEQNNVNLKWPGNPSGRVSTVEEIANLAIFMVSSLGDGIVGDTFFMTGGSGTVCIDK
jgi:NAD(P)-dependent dehydrogenase (short-subunit alcohol dehydrogenase family)